jgi:hypothetical protein
MYLIIDHFPSISYLSLTKEIINLFCRCSVQLCNFRAVDLPLSRRPLSHAGHSLDLQEMLHRYIYDYFYEDKDESRNFNSVLL